MPTSRDVNDPWGVDRHRYRCNSCGKVFGYRDGLKHNDDTGHTLTGIVSGGINTGSPGHSPGHPETPAADRPHE